VTEAGWAYNEMQNVRDLCTVRKFSPNCASDDSENVMNCYSNGFVEPASCSGSYCNSLMIKVIQYWSDELSVWLSVSVYSFSKAYEMKFYTI
jgi:hypothetical protein